MENSGRDRTIESLLRRREIDPPQPTDQCVDAELLAAWMEGGLSPEAHADVEKHAAGCARCQTLLASMARTAVDVESRPWWRTATAKWLVPAAAIATALVVWITVGHEPVPPQQPASIGEAQSASPPPSAATAPAAPKSEPIISPRLAPDASSNNALTQRAQGARVQAGSRQERDKMLERREAPADALRPQGQMTGDSTARLSIPQPQAPAASPSPAVAGALPAAPPAAEAKPAPVASLADSAGVAREVAAKQRAAAFANQVAGVEIQSPDPNYRWRIVPPAAIQRSTDGGTTWSIVDPLRAATRGDASSPNALTAGSSPSRDVCWIVGRAGTVLLSTNGATWQRRPFPENVDLTGVRASTATNAVVTAADGRQFVTIDAGATWNLVK